MTGIAFTDNEGVKKKYGQVTTLEGGAGFRDLMNDICETAESMGGDICHFTPHLKTGDAGRAKTSIKSM